MGGSFWPSSSSFTERITRLSPNPHFNSTFNCFNLARNILFGWWVDMDNGLFSFFGRKWIRGQMEQGGEVGGYCTLCIFF